MLRPVHIALCLITVCSFAWAQDLPTADEAMAAAKTVRGWVRNWAVDDQQMPVAGVSVILRSGGRVIGQGETLSDPNKNLAIATRLAMLHARSRFDAASGREESAANVAISVELAGPLIPVDASSDAELAYALSPGLDGVAVRLGDQVAARFPEQMMVSGQNASSAARALISELSGDPTRSLDEFAKLSSAGYTFYRFRTVELVELSPGTGFVFAHRGGRIVPRSEITSAELTRMADGLALHLTQRLWPGVEPFGLMGTLDPITGQVSSRFEAAGGQALAASALLRYARTPGVSFATEARRTAMEILDELSEVAAGEQEPWKEAGDAALCVNAVAAAGGPKDYEKLDILWRRCAARVTAAFDAKSKKFADDVPETAWGAVALALVRMSKAEGASVSPEVADAAIRATFRATPPDQLVTQFPFLGWAELELTKAGDEIPSAAALADARRMIFEHQLETTTLAPDDRDLAGAIVFTSGVTPLPTWHSIRPFPLLADMISDPRLTSGSLTEGEAAEALSHQLDAMRFLHQLCAGPVEAHMYVRPGRAMWGVRLALWQQEMGIESCAVGLEATCRTLDAVSALAAREEGSGSTGTGP